MNFNINSHMFMFKIYNGYLYIALKKDGNKILVPKYNYKGEKTLEKDIALAFYNDSNIKGLTYHQCHTFSMENKIDVVFASFTKDELIKKINDNYAWYKVNDIDNKIILKEIYDYLKNYLVRIDHIRNLMSEEFSLKELQNLYEYLFKIKLDRRNFRKKLLNLNIVKPTDELKNKNSNGRPSKLYVFTDLKNINLI